ncbi:MAG: 16S rRNA (cytosine(1402)-N(4))-methyltransferase RsmH [FCB group bacterium]|nr:16S rRNA (cytosine(1402)-N(4))-methyltransferase RsmH [FCB group bacterium]
MSAGKPSIKEKSSCASISNTPEHVPVLLAEVLECFSSSNRDINLIVDGTAGFGGHLDALREIQPSTTILGVERDPVTVSGLQERFNGMTNISIRLGSYTEIPEFMAEMNFHVADWVLFDLGLSSIQLNTPERGFSFRFDGPLDMRYDNTTGITASELLNTATCTEIADIIYEYGEERRSRRIAEYIVRKRPIYTTTELVEIVKACSRGNPVKTLSRVFQAFRIAVNHELEHLDILLSGLSEWIISGGKVAFITFHSLEDRKVKQFFRDSEHFAPNSPKWIAPNQTEIKLNSRARSAKLRMGVRI